MTPHESRRARGARSLGDLLRLAAREHPDSEVVFPSQRSTLQGLDLRADAAAKVLIDLGIKVGDTVGLLLPPSLDLVASIFGAARAGAVVVPISDRFRAEELGYVVTHADLSVLLTCGPSDRRDHLEDLCRAFPEVGEQSGPVLHLAGAPRLRRVVVLAGDANAGAFTAVSGFEGPELAPDDAAEVALRASSVGPEDLCYLMYTSGTSADPKACMITHDAVLRQADSLARTRYLLAREDSFWCPLPLFHNGGLATMTACLASGSTFVHAGVFEPGVALEMMERERCTHAIPAFETIWLPVLDHPNFATTDLSALRVVLNAGGTERLRQNQARLPHAIQLANYGCTEATGHLSMTLITDPLDIRLTTGGAPLADMQVRIVEPGTDADLPTGQVGEILFRGPSRFVGYYKDPAATAAVIDAGGWYRTGDLGSLDEVGRVTFAGRVKDMLKVGGENVSSLEVESFLLRHPAVNIAVVVGVPDTHYSEVPAAFVELAEGAQVSEEELIEHCLGRIATYKVPRYVRFVDGWPMSGTKIRKYVLRDRLVAELRDQGITVATRLRVPDPTDASIRADPAI